MLKQYFTQLLFKAGRGAAARGVTVKPTGCGFGPHSRRWNIYFNLYFHFFALVSRLSAALSSATQHAMPPESGRKWATECLNTRFPLPILLCAGYSVKLISFFIVYFINYTFLSWSILKWTISTTIYIATYIVRCKLVIAILMRL